MISELQAILYKLDNRITENEILSQLLQQTMHQDRDYDKFLAQGYTQEDISIGKEIIDVYLLLKQHTKQISE